MTRNIQLFNRNLLIIESYMVYDEVPSNLICSKCSSLHVLCECRNILGVFKCYGYSSRYTNKGKYISVCVVNVSQVFRHNRASFIRHRVLISMFPFLNDISQQFPQFSGCAYKFDWNSHIINPERQFHKRTRYFGKMREYINVSQTDYQTKQLSQLQNSMVSKVQRILHKICISLCGKTLRVCDEKQKINRLITVFRLLSKNLLIPST